MKKENKLVSIIVPIYKVERYLGDCLESLLNQTYKNIEIIAVYNNSPDNTLEVLKKYNIRYPDKIKLITQKKSSSAITRNVAIRASNGEYIAFCDSDDMASPERIEKQVDMMEKNKEIGLTYTDTIIVDPIGQEIEKRTSSEWARDLFLRHRYITFSSVMVRRDILEQVKENGCYLDEGLPFGDDFDFLIRLSKLVDFKRVPSFLTYYRWREGSISHAFIKSTMITTRIFIKHHMILYAFREIVRHLPESLIKTANPKFFGEK